MKLKDFKIGKEYRRIISSPFTAEIGRIYICDKDIQNHFEVHLKCPNGERGTAVFDPNNSQWKDEYEFHPSAFEPVEEPLKFGDKVSVDGLEYYIYIATREDGYIITTSPYDTEIPHLGSFRAFVWGTHKNIKKIVEPPVSKTVELTMEEIADKIGVDVNDLKIINGDK